MLSETFLIAGMFPGEYKTKGDMPYDRDNYGRK